MFRTLSHALLLACVLMVAALPALAQRQGNFVRYASPDGEYSLLLPEAPTVETLRSGAEKSPYLDSQPDIGSIGERAIYKRVDPTTRETISITVTTVKATEEQLAALTEDGITKILEDEFKGETLEKKKISFSKGSQTLVWGTITGFGKGRKDVPVFNTAHYLAGLNSITVVRISLYMDNKGYREIYERVAPSISYVGQ